MKLYKELTNGQYVSCTTRKHNHCDDYFGWFSVWQSKQDYDKGNCHTVFEFKNIWLGTDKNKLNDRALEFINDNETRFDKILKEILSKLEVK